MSDAQREAMEQFFSRATWPSSMEKWQHSGFSLVETVAARSPRFVVDAGCGHNELKGRIPNLVGIDLVNTAADWVCDLVDAPIRAHSVDAVLALGSVNFGTRDVIVHQLQVLASWLTPDGRLYMRGNPGDSLHDEIDFFPWDEALVAELGQECGLELDGDVRYERIDGPWGTPLTRLFWIYRPASSAGPRPVAR